MLMLTKNINSNNISYIPILFLYADYKINFEIH